MGKNQDFLYSHEIKGLLLSLIIMIITKGREEIILQLPSTLEVCVC